MNYIRETSASHSKCLICGRSKIKLHSVKACSIKYAFTTHKIIIKKNSRVCSRHLDKSGLIRQESFHHICTSILKIKKHSINSDNTMGVFEKFIDLETLDEEHCYKITGFNKIQFNRFSKYITSINETFGRTKNELIAIYRFWIRKGIDQTSIAMYRNSTSQQKISDYLRQIRIAIYKDFVPFYLGANKDREFYLTHNNLTTNILHDLEKDHLAIVCDASYTRLEKSSNNSFQYGCWSQQKLDLLTKPFIICCADGYIIDCYGPFQAHLNDAKIFEYILKTDKNLVRILEPHKTLVLVDRGNFYIQVFLSRYYFSMSFFSGFRDIFKTLVNEYKFAAKIPNCQQLELISKNKASDDELNPKDCKRLTTEQTTSNRLVTKAR